MDRTVEAFLAVARSENLTAAADKIGITQPALTKKIRRLELSLKTELFERSSRGMTLTETGEAFYRRAEAIEMHWLQTTEEISALAGGTLPVFSIAAGAAYHSEIAPSLIQILAEEFPATRFIVNFDVLGYSLPQLEAGAIQMILGAFVKRRPEGMTTIKLMDSETTVFASRAHPLSGLDKVTPHDLEGQEWVVYKRDAYTADQLSEYYVHNELMPPKIRMEVDALAPIMKIVSNTRYLTPIPSSLHRTASGAGLSQLNLPDPIWRFSSGLWIRDSIRRFPIVERSIELLPEIIARNAGHSQRL